MTDMMTNEQLAAILEMMRMLLDGCGDIETARVPARGRIENR